MVLIPLLNHVVKKREISNAALAVEGVVLAQDIMDTDQALAQNVWLYHLGVVDKAKLGVPAMSAAPQQTKP